MSADLIKRYRHSYEELGALTAASQRARKLGDKAALQIIIPRLKAARTRWPAIKKEIAAHQEARKLALVEAACKSARSSSIYPRKTLRSSAGGYLPKPQELPGNTRRWVLADIVRIEEAARAR